MHLSGAANVHPAARRRRQEALDVDFRKSNVASDNWTIQVVTGTSCRKICRVLFGSDGSYYVTAPYHQARSASVFISTVFYERRRSQMARDSYVEIGLLEDDERRLKLSHHPDGFAHFSGEGIVSGRDEYGRPKGIGIMSFPLARPPRTGPSFACTVLGLEDFATGDPKRADAVNFEDSSIPPLAGAHGFLLEGSYFPASWREFVFERDGEWCLDMRHNMGSIIRYRVLLSSTESQCFVGLRMNRGEVAMGSHRSGFILSGPSTNVRTVNGERMADCIYCAYPALDDADATNRILRYGALPG